LRPGNQCPGGLSVWQHVCAWPPPEPPVEARRRCPGAWDWTGIRPDQSRLGSAAFDLFIQTFPCFGGGAVFPLCWGPLVDRALCWGVVCVWRLPVFWGAWECFRCCCTLPFAARLVDLALNVALLPVGILVVCVYLVRGKGWNSAVLDGGAVLRLGLRRWVRMAGVHDSAPSLAPNRTAGDDVDRTLLVFRRRFGNRA